MSIKVWNDVLPNSEAAYLYADAVTLSADDALLCLEFIEEAFTSVQFIIQNSRNKNQLENFVN